MDELRYTLLAEGPSDKALMPILRWLLEQCGVRIAMQPYWADLARLPYPPKDLSGKIQKSLEDYPCDLLFIHRDADNSSPQGRVLEIQTAVDNILNSRFEHVCLIPVRMTETWLLIDEMAIRHAAGNPNGNRRLDMPALNDLEQVDDPKRRLEQLLETASELTGRRSRNFGRQPKAERLERLAKWIQDFTPLRQLPAFSVLENDLRNVLQRMDLI